MKLCSVCVNTHKRPFLLANLLKSLINQEVSKDIKFEVIVVDNDPEENGRSVAEKYINRSQIPIHYLHEPIKNISLARNKAVSEAKGDYILFIDDDEEASPKWIQTMVNALDKFDADAAFGRVVSIFNDEAPEWIKSIYIYHRPCGETGTPTLNGRTSNAIVKADWLHAENPPFDPAYGITGGEDSNLFHRLSLKGATFIDCYEGYVTEFMPPERTQPEWLVNRARRTGILYSERTVGLAKNKMVTRLYIFSKATAQYVVSFLMKLASSTNKARRLHWELKMAAYSGHIQALFCRRMMGY
ncbi:MAG: glycosyltransferase family 2 protein [Chloroflexota bacterium]